MSEKLANPAPLGLMGFGMTTVLLNIHNAGFFPISAMILAMGLAYGGMAQVIAGILEYKKGNTFGVTAFTSYGFFWISLVFLILLPKLGLGDAADEFAMGCYHSPSSHANQLMAFVLLFCFTETDHHRPTDCFGSPHRKMRTPLVTPQGSL